MAQFINTIQVEFANRRNALQTAQFGLEKYSPIWKLRQEEQRIDELNLRLGGSISHRLQMEKMHMVQLSSQLQSLDPQQVLRRGFAMVNDEKGVIVDSINKVITDQEVRVLLQDGHFSADVKTVEAKR